MAQATIYGVIDQAYQSSKVTAGAVTTKTTSIAGTWNGGSAIGFAGSEDLGNGMKAYFQQEIGLATDENGGPTSATVYENRNSFVGLSGGFGAVQIGRQYNFAFNNAIANDPLGFSGTAGYAVNGTYGGGAARTSDMIIYMAPAFVPGLGIQVGKAMGEAATTNALPTKTGDSTSWGLTYATGALYVGITSESVTGAIATSPKSKLSTTTITYDLGMVKVGYGLGKTTTGADYAKSGAMSLTVPLGALTLAYSSGDGKSKTGAAAEVSTKVSQYGAHYALSKRTTAYLHQGKQSATNAVTNIYAVGIKHTF